MHRFFALALLLLACTSTPSAPDAEVTDIPSPDRGAPDVAEDSAPKPDAPADVPSDTLVTVAPYACMPCLHDRECGDGAQCVPLDAMTNPAGARGCALPCDNVGSACPGDIPTMCTATRLGGTICTPTGSCVVGTIRRNTACPTSGCAGRYPLCARMPAGDVCLGACTADIDCENGYRRCRAVTLRDGTLTRACLPDAVIGPEACGVSEVNPLHVGAACDDAHACPTGTECLSGLDPLAHGFCSLACTTDATCGDGARCLSVENRGMRCVPTDCACAAGGDALLDRALLEASWTRCNLFFSAANLNAFAADVTRDRFRLPVFDRVHRDWLSGARWARDLGPALDRSVSTLSHALAAARDLRDEGSPRPFTPVPVSAPSGDAPLVDATVSLIETAGGTADRDAITRDAADVPMALQRAMASVLTAIAQAARARDAGLREATTLEDRTRLFRIAPHLTLNTTRAADRPDFTTAGDLGTLLGDVVLPVNESLALAATIEAVDWSAFRGMTGPSFNIDTPMGRVVLRDSAANTYEEDVFDQTSLVIDLGGDDLYQAPVAGNQSVENSVSVLIDLAGDDQYTYVPRADSADTAQTLPSDRGGRYHLGTAPFTLSEVPRQGGARLGVAMLYDLGAGVDHYRSLRMSQGFAAYGVGGLYDDGGDDVYELEAGGQGGAMMGLGVLVDGGGRDRYVTWAFSQGFAYVQGVGVLHDASGDDTYLSRVTPVLYGSPQSADTNSSFTQGAGFGRRADGTRDLVNMAGGMGVLRDRAGNDSYTTGIFGQGTGYWSGMGLLLDGAGDDTYDGRWYVQAGVAHFAFGALIDGGGRDSHNATAVRQNMTAGAGHDFSLGVFLALGAEGDTYRVPNLALGAGNANGAGIFADEGGDDIYEADSSFTLGNAGLETLTDMGRLMRPTVGIFLDGGGMDSYRRATMTPVRNEATWSQRQHTEAPSETGVGADGTSALGF